MEAGEIPTTEGQPRAGTRMSRRAMATSTGRPSSRSLQATRPRTTTNGPGGRSGACPSDPTRRQHMKAVCWHGTHDVRVENVPEPKIINPATPSSRSRSPRSAAPICTSTTATSRPCRRATSSAMSSWARCVEVGREVTQSEERRPRRGAVHDLLRRCYFCKKRLWSLCDNPIPTRCMAEKVYGQSGAGLFGYSHLYGGYAGGQARVCARAVRRRRPAEDSRGVCATSRCCSSPTSSRPATWRRRTATSSRAIPSRSGAAGPVGQFAIRSAYLLGAERVIALDHDPGAPRDGRARARPRRSTSTMRTSSRS